MCDIVETLEQFRDGKISKKKLLLSLPELHYNPQNITVEVSNNDIVRLLTAYLNNDISEQEILDWVNIIWFSEYYYYREEESDSMASVMSNFEELDENGHDMTKEMALFYIGALKKNIEI
jgi:hypothetical protein